MSAAPGGPEGEVGPESELDAEVIHKDGTTEETKPTLLGKLSSLVAALLGASR